MKLRCLVEAPFGVGLEPSGEAEYLYPAATRVRGRQRRGVEPCEHVGSPAGEAFLAGCNDLCINPLGHLHPLLQERGERGVGRLVVLDDQRPEGGRRIARAGKKVAHDGIGRWVAVSTQAVKEVVAPIDHAGGPWIT
jgi:hypothetical protein